MLQIRLGVVLWSVMLASSFHSLLSKSLSYAIAAPRSRFLSTLRVAPLHLHSAIARSSYSSIKNAMQYVPSEILSSRSSGLCASPKLLRSGRLLTTALALSSRLPRTCGLVHGDANQCEYSSSCSPLDAAGSDGLAQLGPPSGIVNIGDTCYLGSALQLLHRSGAYRTAVMRSAFKEGSVGASLQALFRNMTKEDIVHPSSVATALDAPVEEQQDAQEFLLRLITEVDDSVSPSPSAADSLRPGDTLRGVVGNRVNVDQTERVIAEPFYGLSLPLPSGATTLKQCLRAYFQGDVNHTSQIVNAPDSLIIDLKRFTYDKKRHQVVKLSRKVSFPETLNISDFMNVTGSSSATADALYDLSAVIVHMGSAEFGHYVTYVRASPGVTGMVRPYARKAPPAKLFFNGSSNEDSDDESTGASNGARDGSVPWFFCDDAVIAPSDFETVAEDGFGVSGPAAKVGGVAISSTAYVLLYEKKK